MFMPEVTAFCYIFGEKCGLGGNFPNRSCRLAEEPHQALEVLRSRGPEALLPHELQSTQAQATQSDLILQFGEQRFHLLSLALRTGKTLACS